MHAAILSRNQSQLQGLLEKGDCVNVIHRNITPIHMAARCGYDEIVNMLADAHADINCKTKKFGFTPLNAATCSGI